MQVFKFGGASVKDAESVKNVAAIIADYKKDELLVVASAMGKTTDRLMEVATRYIEQTGDAFESLEPVKAFHQSILIDLFDNTDHPIYNEVANCFVEIEWILEEEPQDSRSEEHTSELQSRENLVCRLLLEKKNKI